MSDEKDPLDPVADDSAEASPLDAFDEKLSELDGLSDAAAPKPKSGMGWGAGIAMFVLAATIGGAVGWFGPRAAGGAVSAMQTKISEQDGALTAARADRDALTDRIKTLESGLSDEIQTVERALGDIESRIDTLDTAQPATEFAGAPTDMAPIVTRIDALEALMADGREVEGADIDFGGINSRLDEISKRLSALENNQMTDSEDSSTIEALEARLVALEGAAENEDDVESPVDTSEKPIISLKESEDLRGLKRAFPYADLMDTALSQPPADAGWLGRTVYKRLGSKAPEGTVTPDTKIVESARDQMEAGDIEGAIATLETLDNEIRDPAIGWLDDARLYLRSQD